MVEEQCVRNIRCYMELQERHKFRRDARESLIEEQQLSRMQAVPFRDISWNESESSGDSSDDSINYDSDDSELVISAWNRLTTFALIITYLDIICFNLPHRTRRDLRRDSTHLHNVINGLPDDYFFQEMRLTRNSFNILLDILEPWYATAHTKHTRPEADYLVHSIFPLRANYGTWCQELA
jgi:hypothetical protein